MLVVAHGRSMPYARHYPAKEVGPIRSKLHLGHARTLSRVGVSFLEQCQSCTPRVLSYDLLAVAEEDVRYQRISSSSLATDL